MIPCCELAVFATSRGLSATGCVGAGEGLGLAAALAEGAGEADLARQFFDTDTLLKVVMGFLTSLALFDASGRLSMVGVLPCSADSVVIWVAAASAGAEALADKVLSTSFWLSCVAITVRSMLLQMLY